MGAGLFREPEPACVPELKLGQPTLVVLQAEPTTGEVTGADPPDDQTEKLRLGADLARDGGPTVLLLPVLPAGITAVLAGIMTSHVQLRENGGDAQVLLTRLRQAIAPHVPPQVLDDVVLFLNAAKYRS